MRKILPIALVLALLLMSITTQGLTLGQDGTSTPTTTPTETPTLTPTETPTTTPTQLPTETATIPPTEITPGTPTETPTLVPTETPTGTLETATPTDITPTVTASATASITPTFPTETPTATFVPTLPPPPTGLTRIFFFQGLAAANIDVYANGLQIGGNVATGSMIGPFSLLNNTVTSLFLFPAGDLSQPILFNTLAFEPGSTVLVVAYTGAGGTPALAVYRLDTAAAQAQSQLIVVNASDAPTVDVATNSGPPASVARGYSAQLTLPPGSRAGVAHASGALSAQADAAASPLQSGVVYVQIAVGSVADGSYQVITQTIDLNSLIPALP
jgi:hypothetical protein